MRKLKLTGVDFPNYRSGIWTQVFKALASVLYTLQSRSRVKHLTSLILRNSVPRALIK